MLLKYQAHARIDDLALYECTMHRASNSSAARWWQLWFHVLRDSDGQPELFCVPVQLGAYTDNGPGGRTWGLTKPTASVYELTPGTSNWMISPSINVLSGGDAVAGPAPTSLWHQTPEIVGVPDLELWTTGVGA